MKQLFGHGRKTSEQWENYEELNAEEYEYIEESGEYEGEGEYIEGAEEYEGEPEYVEEPVVYAEEGQYVEEEYIQEAEEYEGEPEYTEEPAVYTEEGQYLEEEYIEEAGEYEGEPEYTEEPVVYAEEGQYLEEEYVEEAGEYEGEPEYAEEPAVYAEEGQYLEEEYAEEYEEYNEEQYYTEEEYPGEKKNVFASIWQKFLDMGPMDRVITCTGVAVLVLALVTGSVYASASVIDRRMDEFISVGSQLDGITLIGEQGLLAMADAQMARLAAANVVMDSEENQQTPEYNEVSYDKQVTVSLNMVSVLKDLKIKFTNSNGGRLIANVPFSVTVTDPNGKTYTWTDDDMDGIIYQKDITPGTYKVVLNALTDEKYANYILPASTQSVEVKKEIAYQKVDVANEVKKESEINVAAEDTKKNETVVESALTDTVEFVESNKGTVLYTEVAKSSIPDPMTLARVGSFMRIAQSNESVSGGDQNGTGQPETVEPDPPTPPTVPVEIPPITLDKASLTVYMTEAGALTAKIEGNTGATISAVSSDTGVATVSVSGMNVTVTGVAPGSATITVSYEQNGMKKEAACAVVIKDHPKYDKSTRLKDSAGNPLFVQEGNGYREAFYADYYTSDKFFRAEGTRYTGWQTIDNKVYYYTASGDKVTGEQVIQGARYNFASDGSLVTGSGTMGIDVSKWNGTIDWNAVKNSGVSYVIIRCGYRGSSQGALIEDPTFVTNIKGAMAADLKVGVYFFTQAVDEVEAVEEASMVLGQISGYRISYPVFLDVETSGGRGDKIDSATRTAVCKTFCETIRNGGYTAGIYANKTWLTSKMDVSALGAYKIWLAQYADTPTYTGRYDLWQYRSTGRVSGISGNVDMNISYLGY